MQRIFQPIPTGPRVSLRHSVLQLGVEERVADAKVLLKAEFK